MNTKEEIKLQKIIDEYRVKKNKPTPKNYNNVGEYLEEFKSEVFNDMINIMQIYSVENKNIDMSQCNNIIDAVKKDIIID
jgi:uncharacterized protein YydD (DUF2326 family)